MTTTDNTFSGKVGTFPGQVKDIRVKPNTSVAEALRLADFSVGEGQTVKLNGVRLTLGALGETLIEEDNFSVIVTGQVNGNA